jgi:hypothetical protein
VSNDRAVADRTDGRAGRSQKGVDDDAVVRGEATAVREAGFRNGAHPDQHHVRRDHATACHFDTGDRAIPADEACNHLRGHEVDSGQPVCVREVFRRVMREGPDERSRQALDHADLLAELLHDAGKLQSDEAATDYGHSRYAIEPRPDGFRVLDRAQVEDPAELRARQVKRAIATSCREHEMIVGERRPAREDRLSIGGLDRGDRFAKAKLDRLAPVECLGAKVQA